MVAIVAVAVVVVVAVVVAVVAAEAVVAVVVLVTEHIASSHLNPLTMTSDFASRYLFRRGNDLYHREKVTNLKRTSSILEVQLQTFTSILV